MKKLLLLFLLTIFVFSCAPKTEKTLDTALLSSEEKIDSTNIKSLFDSALTDGKSYEWLRDLTQNIGARLSGSEGAAKSVVWGEKIMREVGLDSVWLQPVMVPHWVRGEKEIATYTINKVQKNVPICALGFSIATPASGILAEVLEVKSLEEAKTFQQTFQ